MPTSDTIREVAWRRGGFAAQVLDQIGAAVVVTSIDGTILHWNRQAEALYGWNEDEAIGSNLIELSMATQEAAIWPNGDSSSPANAASPRRFVHCSQVRRIASLSRASLEPKW